MKKLIAMLLALVMVMALAACAPANENTEPESTPAADATAEAPSEPDAESTPEGTDEVTVMTHEEYMAAAIDDAVTVECYVQATQSWWEDKITVYAQDADGAYFMYDMACSEEDSAKLVPGAKIRVSGYKAEWSGEIEIVDATFELVEGDGFVADALDVTELLGTEELVAHQNEKVLFKGLTVEKIEYKNGEPGDDIYVTFKYNDATYDFCVERYLTDPETEVYKAVGELQAGDVVDVEGFLYWYEGPNTHITAVTPAA